MSVDEQLRTAMRDAASHEGLDVERALRVVRARVETVDLMEHPRPRARAPRVVAALAGCVLLAGAVALPFALRSTRARTPASASAPGRCGHAPKSGFRSTAVIRFAQTSRGPHITFTEPVHTALRMCNAVVTRSQPRTDEIGFAADISARGDLLSLIVTTPSANDTAALARTWALAFVAARRADAMHQIIHWQQRLSDRVRALHDELRHVDTKLAKLAPRIYGNVLSVDGPSSNLLGRPRNTVPSVPQTGSGKIRNLAFERISLLNALSDSATQASRLRITRIKPDAYASVVSVSAPVRFPQPTHHSGPSGAVVAIGLLVGGALLAAGSFLLGRRSRRAHSL
jgi:hypothetical protein